MDIERRIIDYVHNYGLQKDVQTTWGIPLVGFAAAEDHRFAELKAAVGPAHLLPRDLLKEARTVIAYFLPYAENILNSNIKGTFSSREWALAYIETNRLITDLNDYLSEVLSGLGYCSAVIPATHNFDREKLISDWSHRHVARIAGLGKFGLNNMLITARGCGGRVGSLVTNLPIEPTMGDSAEYCLYKAGGSCQKCVDRCPAKALGVHFFDRESCYQMLLQNDQKHPEFGLTDVCGKCVAGLPCTCRNPVGKYVFLPGGC